MPVFLPAECLVANILATFMQYLADDAIRLLRDPDDPHETYTESLIRLTQHPRFPGVFAHLRAIHTDLPVIQLQVSNNHVCRCVDEPAKLPCTFCPEQFIRI